MRSGSTNASGSSGLMKSRPCSLRSASCCALVDREEQLLLEREELLLARVRVEAQLGLVDGAALVRDPPCARRRPLLRGWPSFTFTMVLPNSSGLARGPSFLGLGDEPIAKHASACCTSCSTSGLKRVELVRRNRGRAGDDQRRARFVDQDRVHFVDDREVRGRAGPAAPCWWPCRCRAGSRTRTPSSSRT